MLLLRVKTVPKSITVIFLSGHWLWFYFYKTGKIKISCMTLLWNILKLSYEKLAARWTIASSLHIHSFIPWWNNGIEKPAPFLFVTIFNLMHLPVPRNE